MGVDRFLARGLLGKAPLRQVLWNFNETAPISFPGEFGFLEERRFRANVATQEEPTKGMQKSARDYRVRKSI